MTPPPAPKPQTLAEYLTETDSLPDSVEESQTIPSHSDPDAARALRELGQLEARIASNKALAAAERAKITEWETTVNDPLQTRAAWLYSLLGRYAIDERNLDPKRKTILTPYGTLATKPAQDVWEIDEEAFIKWAKEHNPSLVRTTEAPEKAKLKQYYQAKNGKVIDPITDEVVEGVKIVPPERPFTITIKPNPQTL
jgi:Bacteriophage Mu Gam like protein.